MRAIFPTFFVLLTAIFLVSACDNSRKQIVGKWKATNSDAAWEFSENGTLDTSGMQGRYTFGDGGRLKIQTSAATFVYQFEFQNDRLILTEPNGSRMELNRIK